MDRHIAVRPLPTRSADRPSSVQRKREQRPVLSAPFEEKGQRNYRFIGQGSYAEMLPGAYQRLW